MLVSIPCFCSASHARMPSHVEAICRAYEVRPLLHCLTTSLSTSRSTYNQDWAKLQVACQSPALHGDGKPSNRIRCIQGTSLAGPYHVKAWLL